MKPLRDGVSLENGALRLGALLEEVDERLGSQPEPEILTLTEKMGFVAQRERFNKRLAIADTSNYKVIRRHDIAFNPYLLWAGAIAQNTDWTTAIISPLYPTFRVRKGYDSRFVNYLLSGGGLLSSYDAISYGSVPRKRRSSVKDFLNLRTPAPLPSLDGQQRIVKLLDEAEALRKLRAQAGSRTRDLAPALFNEMFGASSHSWVTATLRELVQEFRYGTSNKSTAVGKPTLRIPNVIGQAVNVDDLKFVPVSDSEFERLRLAEGDILFVRTNGSANLVGRSAVFTSQSVESTGLPADEFIYASYLIRARLHVTRVHPVFVQYFLSSPIGRHELRARSKTSAGQFNINTEGLGTIAIPVPPLRLQNEFVDRLAEIRELEAEQAASGQRIEILFQSLLQGAFAGEL